MIDWKVAGIYAKHKIDFLPQMYAWQVVSQRVYLAPLLERINEICNQGAIQM